MKAKGIVFTGPRRAEYREEEIPNPDPTQILVQTKVSLLSTGTESWCYRGEFDADSGWAAWVQYPFYPGYSNVGTIVKAGREVTALSEGDRVFTNQSHRQFVIAPGQGKRTIKLPDTAADRDAAWSMLAVITQTAVRRGEHAMGDTAAVIGLGPLGQLVTQYLRVVGAKEVLAIDTVPKRLDMATDHGATQTFCGNVADAKDFIEQHTDGRLVDVIYDVTGHYAVLPRALKLVRDHGTLVLLGDTPHPSRQQLTHDVLRRQIKIVGTQNDFLPPQHADWGGDKQTLLFLEYINRKQMRVDDLVTHVHSPADGPQVYEQLQKDRGETMGILFDWSKVS